MAKKETRDKLIDSVYKGVFESDSEAYFLDGVEQTVTFGNPLTSTNVDAHSGDISWGIPESNLEVFGTDVTFNGPVGCLYSDWYNWTSKVSDAEIFDTLFVEGIRPNIVISAGTESEMQAELDALSGTTLNPDVCSLTIETCDDGDFTLSCDGITFPSTSTYDIRYKGVGNLDFINLNGSNASSVLETGLGTVTIINPATITIDGFVDNSAVFVLDSSDSSIIASTGSTNAPWAVSVQVANIDVTVISDNWRVVQKYNIPVAGDSTIPIVQERDYVYENPI